MDYINLIQQKMGVANYMANWRCTFAALFKTFSLTGVALLLAANVWGFEANESSKVDGNFEVTAALKVGSVDAENSNGIVTELPATGDDNNNTTLATSAAIKAYVDTIVAAAGGGSSAAAGYYPTEVSNESPSRKMDTLQAVDYCAALEEGGHTDWRLPTLEVIATLCRACPSSSYVRTATVTLNTESQNGRDHWVVFGLESKFWMGQLPDKADGHTICVR